jgi:hypothetical protein
MKRTPQEAPHKRPTQAKAREDDRRSWACEDLMRISWLQLRRVRDHQRALEKECLNGNNHSERTTEKVLSKSILGIL